MSDACRIIILQAAMVDATAKLLHQDGAHEDSKMKWPILSIALLTSACSPGEPESPVKWASPATEIVTCEAWAEVPHDGLIYFNNVWNLQAARDFDWSQCIVRDPAAPERYGFSWHWPASGRDIFSQPQAKIGVSPWDPLPKLDSRFPVRIGDLESMTIATEVTVEGPSQYTVVTTLWLTDTGDIGDTPQPQSIVAEVMIWTHATADHLNPAGAKIGTIHHGGAAWDVWLDENWHDVSGANDNRWMYIAMVAGQGGLSAIFDPIALLRSEPLARLNLDYAYIADVELGSEIMRGDGLLWIERFDVALSRKPIGPDQTSEN
jgi:hypothetical protein